MRYLCDSTHMGEMFFLFRNVLLNLEAEGLCFKATDSPEKSLHRYVGKIRRLFRSIAEQF